MCDAWSEKDSRVHATTKVWVGEFVESAGMSSVTCACMLCILCDVVNQFVLSLGVRRACSLSCRYSVVCGYNLPEMFP